MLNKPEYKLTLYCSKCNWEWIERVEGVPDILSYRECPACEDQKAVVECADQTSEIKEPE